MSILQEILDSVRESLPQARRRVSLSEVRSFAEEAPGRASFAAALRAPGTSVIAEVKRASPSKGVLRDPYHPVELVREYDEAGARAVSVLTEPKYFRGSGEHLSEVARAVALPLLRKDFLIDEYQCFEAKAWGASAALLIVAALDDSELRDLSQVLQGLGLDALVEVHTEAEAERALRAEVEILGVNNRDLNTFVTDRAVTRQVASMVPEGVLLVSESGIFSREHVEEVEAFGASAVLVGESILTADSPGSKIRELRGED